MKTKLKVNLAKFFGIYLLSVAEEKSPKGRRARHEMVCMLSDTKTKLSNVETRIAYAHIMSKTATKGEKVLLRSTLGISIATHYRWIKDSKEVLAGTKEVRTVIICQ